MTISLIHVERGLLFLIIAILFSIYLYEVRENNNKAIIGLGIIIVIETILLFIASGYGIFFIDSSLENLTYGDVGLHFIYTISRALQITAPILAIRNINTNFYTVSEEIRMERNEDNNKEDRHMFIKEVRKRLRGAWLDKISFWYFFIGFCLNDIGRPIRSISQFSLCLIMVFVILFFALGIGFTQYKTRRITI